MTILSYVLAFLVAIGVLVAVHEYGHFWMARRLGIRVLRFSIGFGRPRPYRALESLTLSVGEGEVFGSECAKVLHATRRLLRNPYETLSLACRVGSSASLSLCIAQRGKQILRLPARLERADDRRVDVVERVVVERSSARGLPLRTFPRRIHPSEIIHLFAHRIEHLSGHLRSVLVSRKSSPTSIPNDTEKNGTKLLKAVEIHGRHRRICFREQPDRRRDIATLEVRRP
jgi:hypothetical protein